MNVYTHTHGHTTFSVLYFWQPSVMCALYNVSDSDDDDALDTICIVCEREEVVQYRSTTNYDDTAAPPATALSHNTTADSGVQLTHKRSSVVPALWRLVNHLTATVFGAVWNANRPPKIIAITHTHTVNYRTLNCALTRRNCACIDSNTWTTRAERRQCAQVFAYSPTDNCASTRQTER